ncbi:MAG: HDOD domain-containing protein [Gammaproteobacteria bacterium]|nr:HDOD domain-containing protein [Gammaproteobacteria bacterium]
MEKDTSHYAELIKVESIPPLPATAVSLLQMATDPDVEIADIAQLIERDPPLSARLIGIANSAFYSPRQPVTTVKSAIVSVLGLNMVRNIAFGLALTGGLSTSACPRFDLTQYWIMALGTADLASGLARAATHGDGPDPDAVYLSGLLHNLGELLLVHLWPYEMNDVLARFENDPETALVEHEYRVIGVDHWAAGAFLARHWQLPAFVAQTIESLDDRRVDVPDDASIMLLRAARRWVAGVAVGRSESLRVDGVDETYCEYRSTSFLDRFDGLAAIARTMS